MPRCGGGHYGAHVLQNVQRRRLRRQISVYGRQAARLVRSAAAVSLTTASAAAGVGRDQLTATLVGLPARGSCAAAATAALSGREVLPVQRWLPAGVVRVHAAAGVSLRTAAASAAGGAAAWEARPCSDRAATAAVMRAAAAASPAADPALLVMLCADPAEEVRDAAAAHLRTPAAALELS